MLDEASGCTEDESPLLTSSKQQVFAFAKALPPHFFTNLPHFLETPMHKLNALFVASLVALTACGGGGGGGGSSSSSSTSGSTSSSDASSTVFTSSNGGRVNTTVTHAANNESSTSNVSFVDDTSSSSYGSSTMLSAYLLDNGTNTYSVSSSGIISTNLATLSSGNKQVRLGGSAWSYSRYGLFIDKTPNSNSLNTQYIVRHMPYVRYQRYNTAVFTNATYNQVGSMAVGAFVVDGTRWATVTCNVSVAATSTGGEATSIDITLSSCDSGIVTTGSLRMTKATLSGTSNASINNFGATSNGDTFTPSFARGFYGVAGPNSEDLVGEIIVNGTTSVSGVARATRFTFAFGGRK